MYRNNGGKNRETTVQVIHTLIKFLNNTITTVDMKITIGNNFSKKECNILFMLHFYVKNCLKLTTVL
jgi:hypothetical protein